MKADEILTNTQTRRERIEGHLRGVADWFHDREGEMFTRDEATEKVADEFDIDDDIARDVIRDLVSDTVDPIVQVPTHGKKYVGVIEYHEFDGAYGYVGYDDVLGQHNVVVCAQCVHEANIDEDATRAAGNDGSFSPDASFEDLLDAVHRHYEESHDEEPSEVKTGANLLSGTTIAGNTAFHAGNDGSGSGLDADSLEGNEPSDLSGISVSVNDVTANRSTVTQYTNNKGNPIYILISNISRSYDANYTLNIDGSTVAEKTDGSSESHSATVGAMVPNGSTYELQTSQFGKWIEFDLL